MFDCCSKSLTVFSSSLDEEALMQGITDVIVVRHKSGVYTSTQFFACFGSLSIFHKDKPIELHVNKTLVTNIKFTLDKYGYVHPSKLISNQLKNLHLNFGRNLLEYKVGDLTLSSQCYLYTDLDKLLISDVDGTLTKNDIGGIIHNYRGKQYLHDGYHELINTLSANGYQIVWMTMRSLPLYGFSKQYINEHVKVQGPLLMEPEEFFQAMKKELLKKTDNIKANIMRQIREAFPEHINPFIGGLGNRQNDAIAYLHAGIPSEQIYIIDTESDVHKLDNPKHALSYKQLVKDIEQHFPKYHAPRIGYN